VYFYVRHIICRPYSHYGVTLNCMAHSSSFMKRDLDYEMTGCGWLGVMGTFPFSILKILLRVYDNTRGRMQSYYRERSGLDTPMR
jgi:hypothetical protein